MRKILPLFAFLTLAACAQTDSSGLAWFNSPEPAPAVAPTGPTADSLKAAGLAVEQQGDYVQAAQLYRQSLEKDPGNHETELALAEALRKSGNLDGAIALYDDLLTKIPASVDAKEGKGMALMEKGDFNAPIPLFNAVMTQDPNRWRTLNALGILFTTRGLQAEAQQYFATALKVNPGNPTVLNNLGLSLALSHNYNESLTNLTQAASQTDAQGMRHERIELNIALVYAAQGHIEQALAIAENYFTGPQLTNNEVLYTRIAKDEKLAQTYFSMALTQSKIFYEKAWTTLPPAAASVTPSGASHQLSTMPSL